MSNRTTRQIAHRVRVEMRRQEAARKWHSLEDLPPRDYVAQITRRHLKGLEGASDAVRLEAWKNTAHDLAEVVDRLVSILDDDEEPDSARD